MKRKKKEGRRKRKREKGDWLNNYWYIKYTTKFYPKSHIYIYIINYFIFIIYYGYGSTQKWKTLLTIFWDFLVLNSENCIQLDCHEDNFE